MQFRPQGNRIQVLAYRGYDKEKKRANVKLLGSFGKTDFRPSDELMANLSDDEKTELQSYQNTMRQSHEKASRQASISLVAFYAKRATDSLTDPECASKVTEKTASDIYAAMDGLAKSLRRLGFSRVAKSGGKVSGE